MRTDAISAVFLPQDRSGTRGRVRDAPDQCPLWAGSAKAGKSGKLPFAFAIGFMSVAPHGRSSRSKGQSVKPGIQEVLPDTAPRLGVGV